MEKTSASVYIKKGQGRALKAGGLWIYDNEIDRTEGEFENGDMVNVFDFDGYPLGCGFINTRSTITIRMMSRKPHTVVDEDFIEMRVRNAWDYRKSTVDTGSCRLVFGEADFLPGIVIDKFSDVLVVESLALGAIMDVAMSVSSAVHEVAARAPELGFKELFRSGIHVGRDMMGTMSNTLILAFTGTSINTLIFIYAYGYSLNQTINMYSIGIEIIQGISATLGVIFTVPVAAYINALLLKKRKKKHERHILS